MRHSYENDINQLFISFNCYKNFMKTVDISNFAVQKLRMFQLTASIVNRLL